MGFATRNPSAGRVEDQDGFQLSLEWRWWGFCRCRSAHALWAWVPAFAGMTELKRYRRFPISHFRSLTLW